MKITFDSETNTLTIPEVPGVVYNIDDKPVKGKVVITEDTLVTATPAKGVSFAEGVETEELVEFNENVGAEAEPEEESVDAPQDAAPTEA